MRRPSSEGEVSPRLGNQRSSHRDQDSSIYYEVDVTCPELTISGDSEYLDTSSHSNHTDPDLNCTLDLKSDSSSASINVGTQSDISMLGKNFEKNTGTKKRQLEISPELDYNYKRMRYSRDRVSARPPLKHRQIRQPKPTRDYILSISPDKNDRNTTRNIKLRDLNQTCSIQ